jgi:hypothetical protein
MDWSQYSLIFLPFLGTFFVPLTIQTISCHFHDIKRISSSVDLQWGNSTVWDLRYQDPYQEKYAFASITRVSVIQIEYVRACLNRDCFEFKTHGHLRSRPNTQSVQRPIFYTLGPNWGPLAGNGWTPPSEIHPSNVPYSQ